MAHTWPISPLHPEETGERKLFRIALVLHTDKFLSLALIVLQWIAQVPRNPLHSLGPGTGLSHCQDPEYITPPLDFLEFLLCENVMAEHVLMPEDRYVCREILVGPGRIHNIRWHESSSQNVSGKVCSAVSLAEDVDLSRRTRQSFHSM